MSFFVFPSVFFLLMSMVYRTLGRIRNLVSAREVLRDYMQKQVRERKAALTDTDGQERSDVFSLLVRANEEDGKFTLDADELVGISLPCLFLRSIANVLPFPLIDWEHIRAFVRWSRYAFFPLSPLSTTN